MYAEEWWTPIQIRSVLDPEIIQLHFEWEWVGGFQIRMLFFPIKL